MSGSGSQSPMIRNVTVELLERNVEDPHFIRHARVIARHAPSVILLSGGALGEDSFNRYSLAAWHPHQILKTRGEQCVRVRGHETFHAQRPPLDFLDAVFQESRAAFPQSFHPFCGGALGYFSYDLKNSIERLPTTVNDHLHLPDIYLMWPRCVLVHDRALKHLHRLTFDFAENEESASPPWKTTDRSQWKEAFRVGTLQSNFTREEYLAAVATVRDYIRAGDVYQVNLSQQFQCDFEGNPFELWIALFQRNPAPFYAFVNAGDHQIVSTSMERFLLMENGRIETRPIKGTRPRGKTSSEDEALAEDLLRHPKDDAELSMIVDLLRNDLGRICAPRTVRVEEHKRLESYQNVHHLISIVTGRLNPGTTYGDTLKATFPGGSITGCPKIRAMEIIDEMEPSVRHIYTGSLGYLGCHGNMDLNIAIRTAVVAAGRLHFSVGGGIVYDSDPMEEYEETLHKGLTFFQTLKSLSAGDA